MNVWFIFMKKKFILMLLLLIFTSCASKGRDGDKSILKSLTSGSVDSEKLKKSHIVHLMRAIGTPEYSKEVGKYTYYGWKHSRNFGISSIFGGGNTTFYCTFNAESYNGKINHINWYGNECGPFVDRVNEYFKKHSDTKEDLIDIADIKKLDMQDGMDAKTAKLPDNNKKLETKSSVKEENTLAKTSSVKNLASE